MEGLFTLLALSIVMAVTWVSSSPKEQKAYWNSSAD